MKNEALSEETLKTIKEFENVVNLNQLQTRKAVTMEQLKKTVGGYGGAMAK